MPTQSGYGSSQQQSSFGSNHAPIRNTPAPSIIIIDSSDSEEDESQKVAQNDWPVGYVDSESENETAPYNEANEDRLQPSALLCAPSSSSVINAQIYDALTQDALIRNAPVSAPAPAPTSMSSSKSSKAQTIDENIATIEDSDEEEESTPVRHSGVVTVPQTIGMYPCENYIFGLFHISYFIFTHTLEQLIETTK